MDQVTGADFLQLDPAGVPPGGLAAWLTGALRDAVADGRLAVGARVPASRTLATQLGLSRGVVVEAYQRLTDEGLLSARSGGGTRVSAVPGAVRRLGAATRLPTPDLDLSPGVPDLSAFPRAAWAKASREVLAEVGSADLGYGDPRGLPVLREALAVWLGRTRGLTVSPDEILVVNGVAQGLVLLARWLEERGRTTVGFEEPGSYGARVHLQRWGMTTVPVPVDGDGLDVAALDASGVDAVVVTPAHQFPTGVVLSPQRRRDLVEWVRAAPHRLVIEDDYDAEHRYDRPPVAAVKVLAPDQVVHLGSVSKTLAPAMRIGWLVAPSGMQEELVEARYWLDLASPALPQITLARMLTSGAFERHLRLVRQRHKARRDALLEALAEHLPAVRVRGVAAGLHVLATLPDGVDDDAVATAALQAGIAVHPLSRHREGEGPPGLVIGYAATTPDRLREAVRRLAPLVS